MPFYRRDRISPDFLAAPREPSGAELVGAPIDRTAVVAAFDRLAAYAAQRGHRDLVDRVLDERLVVRPAVPVIPGRSA